MDQEFHSIRRLPPYVFAEVNAMKARARAAGDDIIDFGMGNPDTPAPAHVVDKLVETVRDPRTHRYSNSRGIPGLRKANAAYYERRFGVAVDPETETIVTLGSKEGLANLVSALIDEGAGELDSQAFQGRLAELSISLSFSAGRELALALRPSTDSHEVVASQRRTAEARRLIELRMNLAVNDTMERIAGPDH